MKRERLLEMIDACRPGSDDHLHGELAELGEEIVRDEAARELFDEIQSLDARLVELFQAHDAASEVPPGLRQRLEAALAADAAATQDDASEMPSLAAAVDSAVNQTPVETTATQPAAKPAAAPSQKRTWAVMLGSLAAAAAIVLLAVVLREQPTELLTVQQVAERAVSWENDLADDAWHSDPTELTQKLQAMPAANLRVEPFRWQDWQDPWQGQGVVYDLSPSSAPGSVLLYATKAVDNVTGNLPMGPPGEAQASTGDLSVAVWQRNDTLYTLVIHGPQDRYRHFIERPNFTLVEPSAVRLVCLRETPSGFCPA